MLHLFYVWRDDPWTQWAFHDDIDASIYEGVSDNNSVSSTISTRLAFLSDYACFFIAFVPLLSLLLLSLLL